MTLHERMRRSATELVWRGIPAFRRGPFVDRFSTEVRDFPKGGSTAEFEFSP
jgi:hypothetical protein